MNAIAHGQGRTCHRGKLKYCAAAAFLASVLFACVLFLWLGSGWLTVPLDEDGS